MGEIQNGHLTEEELAEIAAGEASGPQLKHLEICLECSQSIADLQIVKSALSSIDDREIPRKTEREILLLSQKSKWEGVQQVLLNPMLTAIITIIMLVLIYFSVAALIF
jgi:hypothetical protein